MPFMLLAMALAIPFATASMRFARALEGGHKRPAVSVGVFSLLIMLVVALFCLTSQHTLFLFAGIWLASLASITLIGEPSKRSFLVGNMVALCFMLASGLLIYGYFTVLAAVNPHQAFQVVSSESVMERSLCAAGSLVLGTVFVLAFAHILQGAYPASKSADKALKPLLLFSMVGSVYELLDAIPLSLGIWFDLMPFFMLGGTVLLTLFCALFSQTTARTGAEAFREVENMALERRRQDQETRMRLYRAQATIDKLTGLMTRRAGRDLLDGLQKEQRPHIVAFIDLDGLKSVNDEHGHLAGDEYLTAFAQAFSAALPGEKLVRWGGDEFLAVFEGDARREDEALERLDAIEATACTGDVQLPVRFSYGLAVALPGESPDDVIRRADTAMYEEKQKRRSEGAAQHAQATEGGLP